jgi:hypothetical protein
LEGSVATAKDGCATQAGPLSFLGATRVLAALVASSLRSAFWFVSETCPLPYFFADDTAASRYDWNMVGEDVSFAFSHLDARGPAGVKHWLEQSPNDE